MNKTVVNVSLGAGWVLASAGAAWLSPPVGLLVAGGLAIGITLTLLALTRPR